MHDSIDLYGRTRRKAKPSTGIEPVTWRLQRDALPLCNPTGCLLLIGLKQLYSKQTDHPFVKDPVNLNLPRFPIGITCHAADVVHGVIVVQ